MQLLKKFPAFHGTRRFITAFKYTRHLSLSWARSIQLKHPSHFLMIPFNITLSSRPGSSKWSLSLRFPHRNPVNTSPLSHTCYMPAHLVFLDMIIQIIFGEQYRSLNSSLCSHLHSPLTSSLLGPNILLSSPFSNTLSLRISLNVTDQVSHPYRRTGKIIVLYIVISVFLDSKLADKIFCTEW